MFIIDSIVLKISVEGGFMQRNAKMAIFIALASVLSAQMPSETGQIDLVFVVSAPQDYPTQSFLEGGKFVGELLTEISQPYAGKFQFLAPNWKEQGGDMAFLLRKMFLHSARDDVD
jgi:hypothetical protein